MNDIASVIDMDKVREQFREADIAAQKQIERSTEVLRRKIEFFRNNDYSTIRGNIEKSFREERKSRGITSIALTPEEQKELSSRLENAKKQDEFFDSLSPEKCEEFIGLEGQRMFETIRHNQHRSIVFNALQGMQNSQIGEYYYKKIITGYKSVDEASLGEKSFAKKVRCNIAKSKASLKTLNAAKIGKMALKTAVSVAGIAVTGLTGFATGGIPGAITRMAIASASMIAVRGGKAIFKMIKAPDHSEEIDLLKKVGLYDCLEKQIESQDEMRKFLKENRAGGLSL